MMTVVFSAIKCLFNKYYANQYSIVSEFVIEGNLNTVGISKKSGLSKKLKVSTMNIQIRHWRLRIPHTKVFSSVIQI